MHSRGGQKIQGARKIHTAEKKELQQAQGRTIFNSGISRLISVSSR